MRLQELGQRLPTKAGQATLAWFKPEEGNTLPRREGDTILLPAYSDAEILRLQDRWNQFLFLVGGRAWFGGTDENPFLVRLDDHADRWLFQGGTSGFYKALIPKGLCELANEVGTRCQFDIPERQTYIRQGDIFAYPLPFSWEEISRAHHIVRAIRVTPRINTATVLGTRHTLTGSYLDTPIIILDQELALVAEGTILAPDHTPVKLTGPHALFQTAGLYNPPEAD